MHAAWRLKLLLFTASGQSKVVSEGRKLDLGSRMIAIRCPTNNWGRHMTPWHSIYRMVTDTVTILRLGRFRFEDSRGRTCPAYYLRKSFNG